MLNATLVKPLKVAAEDKILSMIVKVAKGINPIPPITIVISNPLPVIKTTKEPTIFTVESAFPQDFLTRLYL